MTHIPSPTPIALTAEQDSDGDHTHVGTPKVSTEGPALTWESLHNAIATALRRVDLRAPLYVTADVLTDELLPSFKGVRR